VNPSYMWLSEDKQRFYTVEETREGQAVSWKLEGDVYVPDGKEPTFGSAPCHVFVHEDVLILANYGSGSMARCKIAEDGSIKGTLPLIQHQGRSVMPMRQEGPHAHFAMLTPDGKYIAACDLGLDQVIFYEADDMHADLPKSHPVTVPGGCGPRHAAFLSHDEMWYVASELSSDLLVYRGYAEKAELLQHIPLTPGVKSAPAAIRISPDEKYLFVSNRGEDTLSLFRILPDGTVEDAGKIVVGAEQPRDAIFSPDGKYIAVACQKGSSLIIFSFEDGKAERICDYPIEGVSSALWA